jgi:hypothetical protein
MNGLRYKSSATSIDELPDRIAHRRKIAERIALDAPEYAANDPTRNVDRKDTGYRALGPNMFPGSGRGPKAT